MGGHRVNMDNLTGTVQCVHGRACTVYSIVLESVYCGHPLSRPTVAVL